MKKAQKQTKLLFSKNHFENLAWSQNLLVCGVDEVGRGSLVGQLVVAAAILPPHTSYKLLKDSKLMTKEEREQAYTWITKNCWYSVTMASHHQIDEINIYQATIKMMHKAIVQLFDSMEMAPETIKFVVSDAMPLHLNAAYTHEKLELAHFPKGEQISATIAAASIVAKVTRDRMMESYEYIFPHHGLAKHKGYATKEHIAAIRTHGPTIFHRTSFLTKIQAYSEPHEEQNNLF